MGQNHSNFQDFEKYVNAVLMQNGIFDKSYRKYGITPLNQRFVLIAHTDAVRLIMETEYKDASNFISLHMGLTYMFTNIYDTKPPEGEDRLTDDNIDDVVNKRHADLEAGGNKYYGYPERIIATPKDCVQNPDATLKRGDHIRRHCNHIFFHDGIYLGNGRVAHISAPHTSTNFKRDAGARIDTLEKFAKGNPIAIVEQYIRHRHRLDIANDAERDAKSGLWQGEYDVAMRNCQHFAYKSGKNYGYPLCDFNDFEAYVNEELQRNHVSDESYRKYGITPLNQRFVIIARKYGVALITETDYKGASHFKSLHMVLWGMLDDVYSFKVPDGEDRLTPWNIDDVVNKRHADLEAGGNKYFGYPERIIATPKDCVQNPDATLKRGDHIRRRCSHAFFHDGIYLGDGLVAHISAPHSSTNFKRDAGARIDTLEKFAKGNPIAIVEQYIRRRHRLDIANDAEKDAKSGLWQGEYDVAKRNCQHFAYKCAINVNKMCCFDRTNAELLGFFKKLNNLISG